MTRIWPTIEAAVANAARTTVAPLAWNPARHLLSRFAFGPDPASLSYVAAHGLTGWWNQQVTLGTRYPGYAANAAVAAVGPMLKLTPAQVRAQLKAQGNEYGWTAMDQLTQVTLGLQAWSPAQLYETVVDFFANHLNVANHSDPVWTTRGAYDRDVTRKYAFGRFTDMLHASAKHPAMLLYLNLAESTKQAVNENYGRELLELHTVGLNYTEDDVKNCARALTGRTLDSSGSTYVYNAAIHDTSPVKVLQWDRLNLSASAGEAVGDQLLTYLAGHPDTAAHLATKLCLRYVSDTPSAELIGAVTDAYLTNGTNIMPMLSTIVRSDEFWSSRGAKQRRPAELILATLRLLGAPPAKIANATGSLHWMTASVGQTPLDWSAPNGYPDVANAWRSSGALLQLWDYHLGLASNWFDGFGKVDPTTFYGTKPTTSGQAVGLLCQHLTGQPFSATHQAALQTFLGEPASTPMNRSVLAWMILPLVGLILNAPHHALR